MKKIAHGFEVGLKTTAEKTAEKKLHDRNKNVLDCCKIEICTHISLWAIAIDKIVIAG